MFLWCVLFIYAYSIGKPKVGFSQSQMCGRLLGVICKHKCIELKYVMQTIPQYLQETFLCLAHPFLFSSAHSNGYNLLSFLVWHMSLQQNK